MDTSTVLGIVVGITLILLAVGASLPYYIDVPSVLIVGGGVVATTLICYPFSQVMSVLSVVKKAFITKPMLPSESIAQLVHFAERARREGILSLENALHDVDDPFLRSGIRLAVDGVEPEIIRSILETELSFIEARHRRGQSIFLSIGTYAPAYGMIGTLIGLVAMLRNLEDPAKIGPGMAVAILTTLYGSLVANLVALPIANKLKERSADEILLKEIAIEGIMSIQSGDNPRIVEQKLLVFLSPAQRPSSEEAA